MSTISCLDDELYDSEALMVGVTSVRPSLLGRSSLRPIGRSYLPLACLTLERNVRSVDRMTALITGQEDDIWAHLIIAFTPTAPLARSTRNVASLLSGANNPVIMFVLNCIGSYSMDFYFNVLFCFLVYFIVFYCIELLCIVFYCIELLCIVFYCILLYCILFHCFVLYCFVLYCFVFNCIVLYYFVLYFFVLYCIIYSIVIHGRQTSVISDLHACYITS